MSDLDRIHTQQVGHDDFEKVYAFSVDIVDSLAVLPPCDLRWIYAEQLGETFRPDVTHQRRDLLLRGDSHDPNLAVVTMADEPISSQRPALLLRERRCLVEYFARNSNRIAGIRF